MIVIFMCPEVIVISDFIVFYSIHLGKWRIANENGINLRKQ